MMNRSIHGRNSMTSRYCDWWHRIFGKAFIRRLLDHSNPKRVVVFSRDELKQVEMEEEYRTNANAEFFVFLLATCAMKVA